MKRVAISLLLVFGAFVLTSAQENSAVTTRISNSVYQVGERLTYNISFSHFVTAGHIELLVAGRGNFFGREAIQLKGHVETTGVVNAALLAINNDYITYVDPASGIPFRGQQIVREAMRSSDTSVDYNQPVGTAAIPPRRLGEFTGTYDYVAAIYRLRALPLGEGSNFFLTVRGENENYQLDVKVTGREVIKTSVGSFNTIACDLKLRSRSGTIPMKLYLSDDERRVPALLTAKISTGVIRFELAGSEIVATPAVPAPTPTPAPVAQTPRTPLVIPPSGNSSEGDVEGLPFRVGEQLNFLVSLPSINGPVARASFMVRSRSKYFNRDGLLVTLSAQTTNALQRLFVANDNLSSYIDPKTLLPFRSELTLVEGRRRETVKLTINQDLGAATPEGGNRIDIPVGTHDYLSFFYALRTFNLNPARRNAVSILVNNKPKTLFITVLKRETVQLGTESIPAIQVSLTTDDPEADKYQLRGWISDDKRRLPLRLTAVTQLGPIRADLAIIPVIRQ